MPQLPLVSVVTCSYNNAEYILETLESIKNQSYDNIELVIVDDCSTDNSVSIIENWLAQYKGKFKFIKHEVNSGGSIPYNVGLRNATGKYYVTVDTDDVLMPEKIERQVAILEAAGDRVAAVYSDAYVMNVKSEPIDGLFIQRHRQFDKAPSGNIYGQLLQGNFIPIMTLLIRRSVFDELGYYDESLVYGDFDMWLRIASKYEILFSDYVSGKYRIRPSSLSFTIRNWDYANATILLKHKDAPLPVDWINKIATHAYTTFDDSTMPLIKELAIICRDRYLMTTYLLWAFRVAPALGRQVQKCVSAHIDNGLSSQVVLSTCSESEIFMQEVSHSIPLLLCRKMALDALERSQPETLKLIDRLADKNNDQYLKIASLTGKYNVDKEHGKELLNAIVDLETSDEIKNVAIPFDSESNVFWGSIVPVVSDKTARAVAIEDYKRAKERTMLLLNELGDRNRDRFLKTIYLLWKFKVRIDTGTEVLENMLARIEDGLSNSFNKLAIDDEHFFINEIAPCIAPRLMKKIVTEDPVGDNSENRSFVQVFVKDKADSGLIATCLAWKFNIPAFMFTAIVATINQARAKGETIVLNVDMITNADALLKELKPLLPAATLKELACEAYYNNSEGLRSFVNDLARNDKSRYYKAIARLWKYRVNAYTGKIILQRVNGYCEAHRHWFYIDLCIYKDIYGAYKTKNAMV